MSNVNLEPFELSLWKDRLVEKIIPNDDITENSLINIYRGLNTDEKDLSFWYLPRRWKGVKFNPISDDNKYKVNVDIDPPSERENSLVHVDFSTSNLDFKPNTYYTFLLHLDFSKNEEEESGEAVEEPKKRVHKLPNWDSYIKYNPDKASHYLISLIRQDVPDSQWNIPKPIFDSSVALSYNMNGFNLLNSELHNYDDAKLFIHKATIDVDGQPVEEDVDHVVLTCFAKTNNFLSEKATVGMWSFLEAWVEDYWNADMEIYVFEETIKEENIDNKTVNVPQIYKRILNELSNGTIYYFEDRSIQEEVEITSDFNETLMEELFISDETGIFYNNFNIENPINENGDFGELKEEVDVLIETFYRECTAEYSNLDSYEIDIEIESNDDDDINKEDTDLISTYEDTVSSKLLETLLDVLLLPAHTSYSKKISEIFLKYFPGLAFPYQLDNQSDNTMSYLYQNCFSSASYLKLREKVSNFFQKVIGDIRSIINIFCFVPTPLNPENYTFYINNIDIRKKSITKKIKKIDGEDREVIDKITFNISFNLNFDWLKEQYWKNFIYEDINDDKHNAIYEYLKSIYYDSGNNSSSEDDSSEGKKGYLLLSLTSSEEEKEHIQIALVGLMDGFAITLSYINFYKNFLIQFYNCFCDKNNFFSNKNFDGPGGVPQKRIINNMMPGLYLIIYLFFGRTSNIDIISDVPIPNRDLIYKKYGISFDNNSCEIIEPRYNGVAYFIKILYNYINENNKRIDSTIDYFLQSFKGDTSQTFTDEQKEEFDNNILGYIQQPNKKKMYLKEEKQFIFGEQNGPSSFAQEISFNESAKDIMHTLTFSLYNNYYDRKGNYIKNPYINLIHEEDKIKYYYKNKWYDLIITDTQLDNISNKITYTAKDANIIELSKIGFNKTFNTELDNNVGTINELAETAIKNTGWVIDNDKMEKFNQELARPIIGGYIGDNWYIELSDYYYNTALEQEILEKNNIKIDSGSFVYLFYNDDFSNSTFKIIIPNLDLQECNLINKSDYAKLNNTLTNVNLYPSFEIKNINDGVASSVVDHMIPNTNIIVSIPEFIDLSKEIVFDYSLRANDIVTKPITHYSVPLKRYVTEYTHKIGEGESEILYGYVESEYTTKSLVSNLLPNGEDFTSLDGWITGAVNKYFKIENNLGAATRDETLETITPYLTFSTSIESGSNIDYGHGFVCNTELGYNFAEINKIDIGDEFVLRVQVERGENFTPLTDKDDNEISEQLILMETMRPYIYAYDNPFTLQSGIEAKKILPLADRQVINFIQEKRHQEQGKFNSKIINESSNASNGSSIYNDCYHLYYTYNKHNLVPVYWYQYTSSIDEFPFYDSGTNYFPCVYVQKEFAANNSQYFASVRDVSKIPMGGHKSYCFKYNGWEEFRKLFLNDETIESAFSLKDFAIICDFPKQDCFGFDLTSTYSNPFSGATSIKYYLPMLFSDRDLMGNNFNVNSNIQKNFFKPDSEWGPWRDKLSEKEYYELKDYRAFQYNGDMICDTDNGIAATYAQDDFYILMRMRMYWNCIQYSETGTCIFETSGTFCGKPIKISDGHYEYTVQDSSGQTIGPKSYTREDLLDTHLGLFFTFDSTLYDDGGHGNTKMAISSVQLFRKYQDANGELILPDKTIESNVTPIYYLYNPEKNKNVIDKNDIQYEYIGTYLDDSYQVNIDLTGEKKNSITITESNSYNILQKLAEIFDAWLIINVEHDGDGAVKLDDNYKPIKKIYFINSKYNDNFAGIKYGINLNKIDRKIDSNDIINKLIIKNNNNEFGENKICSIVRSKYNLNGSNSIFNLDYLININPEFETLKELLYNKIYPRTYAYGMFLSDLIKQLAQQLIAVSQTQSASEYNKLILNEAQKKLNSNLDKYNSLSNVEISDPDDKSPTPKQRDNRGISTRPIGYYIINHDKKIKLPASVQNIINTFIFYNNLINGFTVKYNTSIKEYNAANSKYNILQDIRDSVTAQRDSLLNEFQSLCAGRIREGAWSSEDYIDDDLYYLDGERQLKEFSVPRVSYTIDIVDLSSLPGYEAYDFNLRDKTTIEDPEVFGYIDKYTPVKEEIIITEKTTYPQSPEKNQIVVQNYKTNFSDLFQRMASTIQAVELGTLHYSNTNSSESIDARVTNNESNIQAFRKYNNL